MANENEKEKDNEKKYAPILPYDMTLTDNFQCYDNTAYVCNRDRIEDYRIKETSNITKYYSYKMNDDNEAIGGQKK